jgi:transcriptional regulator GlxA family with amidase domain
MPFPVHGRLDATDEGDLLVVVAGFDVLEHATKPVLGLLRRVLPRFGAVAGVESGAWVLGRWARSTGDGRRRIGRTWRTSWSSIRTRR